MNKNKFKKGFTLIELLVVIAIIGILAAVLLVNLAGTRTKAKDSAIELEMGQVRTAVENFFLAGSTYVGFTSDLGYTTLQTDINSKSGGTITTGTATTSAYCVSTPLVTSGSYWCVDSTGYAGPPTNPTYCSTNNKCK